ncbi:hypothetical protein ES332_D13G217800v1 [Gossypium tomentosum]|uniref:Uncharacterized protein n=1 Tax=Gossypium tomentosum TaxID=34277 RepID=A0A5D2HZR9_GOSTO|nr:hypothetical protein ES332_D13G217800v1 [Gossypium tomentosum]
MRPLAPPLQQISMNFIIKINSTEGNKKMVEEGTDEGPTNEPLIVSGYNGDGLISRKCSPITSSLVLGVTVAANASFTCG